MKKSLIIITLVMSIILCSCSAALNAKTAESFDSRQTDNISDNLRSGGRITFLNGSLYISKDLFTIRDKGIFRVNESGCVKIYGNETYDSLITTNLKLFHLNNELYGIDPASDKIVKYSESENKFIDCKQLNSDMARVPEYISDDLIVWSNNYDEICYRYKNSDEIKVKDIYTFYVKNNKIYCQGYNGSLRVIDCAKLEKDSSYICELKELNYGIQMVVTDSCCYYLSNSGDFKHGWYRYSFDSDSHEFLTDKEICAFIPFGDKVYFSFGSSIYTDDGKSFSKFADIPAEELYIVDEDWLYCYNSDNMLLRTKRDNPSITERVIYNKR